MGLLDDAIKDHLELKRRHGADPGEVARLEHEALGPARREPAAAVAPVADPPALLDQDTLDDDPALGEERVRDDEPPSDDADITDGEPLLDDEDDGYEDEVTADERLEAPVHHAAAPPRPTEAVAPVEQETPAPAEPVEQPTRQFSLHEFEEASEAPGDEARTQDALGEDTAPEEPEPEPHADIVPADDEPESDDVLEETPEFLQETPEHDRLWFEQKPPRDFDF
jgi:hypothetical protein